MVRPNVTIVMREQFLVDLTSVRGPAPLTTLACFRACFGEKPAETIVSTQMSMRMRVGGSVYPIACPNVSIIVQESFLDWLIGAWSKRT